MCDIFLEDVFSRVVFTFFLLLSQCFIISMSLDPNIVLSGNNSNGDHVFQCLSCENETGVRRFLNGLNEALAHQGSNAHRDYLQWARLREEARTGTGNFEFLQLLGDKLILFMALTFVDLLLL